MTDAGDPADARAAKGQAPGAEAAGRKARNSAASRPAAAGSKPPTPARTGPRAAGTPPKRAGTPPEPSNAADEAATSSAPHGAAASAGRRGTASPSGTSTPDSAELAARLRAAIQHLMPLLRAQSVHGDLTPSRLTALAALADGGPLRISELAARMGIALSTASRMVDLQEGLGWIDRRPDPVDLRASLVSLTDEGQAVLRSVRSEHAGKLAVEIARLPSGRIRSLHEALPALEALAAQVQHLRHTPS